ncbi:DUF6563 family protein [Bacteroides sp. 224]|uniref:DUF6563 family protein n=1 Tax=Bacteroides sp. 224 TaxID=2302936 RepID=UPI0013D21C51|nr:DUF6563 family protein [Bacteroides sp. 224]NDV63869.1 hypothetical protein [Bacteroides sp. 224]
MKKYIMLLLCCFALYDAVAQDIIYHSLKDFMNNKGDTLESPQRLFVEKRTKNQIMLTGGADYKITSNRVSINRQLKSAYMVRQHDDCFVNCKKLRFNKLRFGGCYASAMLITDKIYFSAIPLGVAAMRVVEETPHGLGALGDAITTSAVTTSRVYYEIDPTTGRVEFVGKEKMEQLLKKHPELLKNYLSEDNEEATTTGKYLLKLKEQI